MSPRHARVGRVIAGLVALAAASFVHAHSASDAYLTLDIKARPAPGTGGETLVRGQWDIALRDLNFVLKLDDNGDGKITWGELRKHETEIVQYAYAYLRASDEGKACTVRPDRVMVDNHADGAYAALFFDIVCTGATQRVTLDYRLFFAIDPSHRAILVLRSGTSTATSLLAPDNARIDLKP